MFAGSDEWRKCLGVRTVCWPRGRRVLAYDFSGSTGSGCHSADVGRFGRFQMLLDPFVVAVPWVGFQLAGIVGIAQGKGLMPALRWAGSEWRKMLWRCGGRIGFDTGSIVVFITDGDDGWFGGTCS